MNSPDTARLKDVIRAAPPGRDRLLVLLSVVSAGRHTVDQLRTLTLYDARRMLLALDKQPFAQAASRYLDDVAKHLDHDDLLFPSQKLDARTRKVRPVGRITAWRILHDALRRSEPPDPLDEATGFVDVALEPLNDSGRGFLTLRKLAGRPRR